jgi:multiple sugar transport system substrate-binding protein
LGGITAKKGQINYFLYGRKIMHSRFLTVLTLALIVLSLGAVVMAQDTVTIQVWTGSSSDVENAFKEAQVAAFEEANPNVDVELLISPDYGTQIRASFASGDYPEVFTVGQFDFPQWQADGLLASGQEAIVEQDDIYQGLRDAFTVDGELYCAPKDFSTLALFYNTDLFEAAGVEVPTEEWTWADFAAAAEALTGVEEGVVGFSAAADINRWLALFAANGASVFDDEGNVVVNSPEALEAFTFYSDLVRNGFAAQPGDLNAGWNGEAFGQGTAAMTIEGNWAIGYLETDFPDLNWGVTQIPLSPNGGRGTLTFTECWAVSSRAEGAEAEAAWALVNFMTGPEAAMQVAEAGFGVMPARISASEAWLTNRGESLAAFVQGADYAWAPVFPIGFDDFNAVLAEGTTDVLNGDAEPQDVLDEAAEVATELQAESE